MLWTKCAKCLLKNYYSEQIYFTSVVVIKCIVSIKSMLVVFEFGKLKENQKNA